MIQLTTLQNSKGTIIRSSSPQYQIIFYFVTSGFINVLQNVGEVAEGIRAKQNIAVCTSYFIKSIRHDMFLTYLISNS